MRREDKEYLDEVARGIRAEIKAGNDMLNYALQQVVVRQDRANNRVEKIESKAIIRLGRLAIPAIVVMAIVAVFVLNELGLLELIKILK